MRKFDFIKVLLLLLIGMYLVGCAGKEEKKDNQYLIYVLNKDETRVDCYEYDTDTIETTDLIAELLDALKATPKASIDRAAMSENLSLASYVFHNKQLVLDFDESYFEMTPTQEVLSRAAIVRTMCQVEGVEYVSFLVAGKDLVNSSGISVGRMNEDTFVENTGKEINAYEKTNLTLYYTDEEGVYVKACQQQVYYNTNISMEKLIVEQLIKGPKTKDEDICPTINPDTKVISVTVKDGTCYVNLSDSFLTPVEDVSPEVTIYSIVNSLTELTNVNKVQFSIDGETDVTFLQTISLSGLFEHNYEIIE